MQRHGHGQVAAVHEPATTPEVHTVCCLDVFARRLRCQMSDSKIRVISFVDLQLEAVTVECCKDGGLRLDPLDGFPRLVQSSFVRVPHPLKHTWPKDYKGLL